MPLETELEAFAQLKPELLQHHLGKFALIIGRDLVGTFDTREEAYRAGIEARGNVPMLIKLVVHEEPTESIPAMTLGLLTARL